MQMKPVEIFLSITILYTHLKEQFIDMKYVIKYRVRQKCENTSIGFKLSLEKPNSLATKPEFSRSVV